mgnify:CR=1 FL=1
MRGLLWFLLLCLILAVFPLMDGMSCRRTVDRVEVQRNGE